MVKIKLLGIGKSELRSYFVFPKEQNFLKVCRQFLLDIGVKRFDADSFARPTDEKFGEPLFDKEVGIGDYTDRHYGFCDETGEFNIEIIFGKSKVFLIIYTKSDKQKEISQIVDKFVED